MQENAGTPTSQLPRAEQPETSPHAAPLSQEPGNTGAVPHGANDGCSLCGKPDCSCSAAGIAFAANVAGHAFEQESPNKDCSCGWRALDEERRQVAGAQRAWERHVDSLCPIPPGTRVRADFDDEGGVREITARQLVLRALRNARPIRPGKVPRWAAVSDSFGLGSTYSIELCRNFDLNPHEQIDTSLEEDL